MSLEILKYVNCTIFSLLNVFLIYEMRGKSSLKLSLKRWIVIILVSVITIYIANHFVPMALKLPFLIIHLFLICQLMYKVSFVRKILICTVVISITGLADTLVSTLFTAVLKIDLIYMLSSLYYYTFYNILNILIVILVIILFKTNRFMLSMNKNMSDRSKRLLFVIILLQFLSISVQFFISYYIINLSNLYFISIISYLCSIISIATLLYSANDIIDKENIIKVANEYNEKLKVYNEVLQSSIENQRKIAHEHGNQLAVLSGYIASFDLEKAKSYLDKILGNCNSENEFLSHIKESGLKALLVFKVAMIERRNIEFEFVADDDIHNTIIPSEDLCQIIGIFLDNAIDATSQAEEPYITMSILKNDSELNILIMNSIKDENIDVKRIYEKGYSSNGEGRGFGLHIVDEIIKKYEELKLHTRVEEGLFIQDLCVVDKNLLI